jgi:hypothetical protein
MFILFSAWLAYICLHQAACEITLDRENHADEHGFPEEIAVIPSPRHQVASPQTQSCPFVIR